jgi:hypothetical protein
MPSNGLCERKIFIRAWFGPTLPTTGVTSQRFDASWNKTSCNGLYRGGTFSNAKSSHLQEK